jgi:Zn-dependent protease/CBS domain-containing protein
MGSVYGVPIYIDYSFFLIFGLIVWSVGFVLMPSEYPELSQFAYLAIGLVSAILLFVSILVHELAHSIIAKRNGLHIARITLFLFGGVSEIQGQPDDPNLELRMAAAGPLTSLAIAGLCYVLWLGSAAAGISVLIQAPLDYSFLVNAIVAGFNLIPAFPMDGGRILRAALWRHNHDLIKSTKDAALIGKIFSYAMTAVGILLVFIDFFTGLWLVLIAWFVYTGAGGELRQTLLQRDLAGLKSRSMMTRNVDSVKPDMSLSDLSAKIRSARHNGFPVVDDSDDLIGCITNDSLHRVKKELWTTTRVRDVMTPRDALSTVMESEPAIKALQLMSNNRIGLIFVLDDSTLKLAGIITRSDIARTIQSEESMFNTGGARISQIISVDQGMLFELEAPDEDGPNWSALFNQSEFALIEQKVLQLSNGGQAKQFTFQPLQKGRFFITLNQEVTLLASPGSKPSQKQVKYTIIVN